MPDSNLSFAADLEHLLQEAKEKPLTLQTIIESLASRGYPLILMLLSIPFCQPLQIPGVSTPFGLCIAWMGARMLAGKPVWLPRKFQNYTLSSTHLIKIITTLLRWTERLKRWIHPRFPQLCNTALAKILHGITLCLLGIFLALPLPIPFSNLLAAWSIFLISIGLLEDDGLWILVGYLCSLGTLGLLLSILRLINHI